MKRLFDLTFSGIGILLFLPFGVIIMAVLRFSGEGEIFYRQRRVGKNGNHFGVLKFATMRKGSEQLGTVTLREDPRVLPVGRILRKTKLNEVPQLWNIFAGDMSIVGPRPLVSEAYETVPSDLLSQTRHLTPGLTGVGSIIFRDEEKFVSDRPDEGLDFYRNEIMPFKAELEVWYGANQSMWLDLKLVFLTAWIVGFSNSRLPQIMLRDLPSHPVFNPGKLVGERDEGGAGPQ